MKLGLKTGGSFVTKLCPSLKKEKGGERREKGEGRREKGEGRRHSRLGVEGSSALKREKGEQKM